MKEKKEKPIFDSGRNLTLFIRLFYQYDGFVSVDCVCVKVYIFGYLWICDTF